MTIWFLFIFFFIIPFLQRVRSPKHRLPGGESVRHSPLITTTLSPPLPDKHGKTFTRTCHIHPFPFPGPAPATLVKKDEISLTGRRANIVCLEGDFAAALCFAGLDPRLCHTYADRERNIRPGVDVGSRGENPRGFCRRKMYLSSRNRVGRSLLTVSKADNGGGWSVNSVSNYGFRIICFSSFWSEVLWFYLN